MKRAVICLAVVLLATSHAAACAYFSSVDRFYVHFGVVGRFKVDQRVLSAQTYVPSWETVDRWYVAESRVGRGLFDDRITVGVLAVTMETLSAQSKIPSSYLVGRLYTDVITVGRYKVDMTKPVGRCPSFEP